MVTILKLWLQSGQSLLDVILGLNVRPIILRCVCMSSIVLLTPGLSIWLYSRGVSFYLSWLWCCLTWSKWRYCTGMVVCVLLLSVCNCDDVYIGYELYVLGRSKYVWGDVDDNNLCLTSFSLLSIIVYFISTNTTLCKLFNLGKVL